MRLSITITAFALVGCKDTSPQQQAQPAPTSGFVNVLGGGAPAAQQPQQSQQSQQSQQYAAPTSGGNDCDAIGARIVQLGDKSKPASAWAAHCQKWSASLQQCVVRATSGNDLAACGKLAFEDGNIQIQQKRVVQLQNPMPQLDPPILSQDGDVVAFSTNGQQCGMVLVERDGATAAFVICDGKVITRPLTTEAELRDAIHTITEAVVGEEAARIAGEMTAGHNAVMSVMSRFPHGGGTWNVYDRSTGQKIGTTY